MPDFEIKWRGGWAQLHGAVGGRRIRSSLGTRDPAHAARKAAEIEARLRRAELYGAENEYTFADAVLKYLEGGGEDRYLKPIIEAFGKKRLKDIKPGHIRELAQRLKPHAKPATRNRHVVVPARSVINHAADLGMCSHMRVRGFKEADVAKVAIDRAWIDAFRAHAVNHRLATLALFNFVTGARIGEAVELTPDHFDLDRKVAAIAKTKNGNGRIYHLTDELVDDLRKIEPRKVKDGTLRTFGYSSANSCIWAWKETCRRAGITYVSRHEAGRHSAATEAVVRNKVDVVTAAKLLGWKDPKVLLKRYAHAEKLAATAEAVFGTEKSHAGQAKLRVVKK